MDIAYLEENQLWVKILQHIYVVLPLGAPRYIFINSLVLNSCYLFCFLEGSSVSTTMSSNMAGNNCQLNLKKER